MLSDDEDVAEREGREKLRSIEARVRELRARRQLLLNQVHQFSDEQRALYDEQAPRQDALERANDEHRQLGRNLNDLRRQRDAARTALDAALLAVRMARQELPREERERPRSTDQIKREMAQLELRQQTTALPLPEENALIDQLRQLKKLLGAAEKERAAVEGRGQRFRELELALGKARAEHDRLGVEMTRARRARDQKMESMRAQLLEVGRRMAELREKAKVRSETMVKVEAMNYQLGELDREAMRIVDESRSRRQEAQRTIREHSRNVRDKVGEGAYARTADQQLEQLMKRGKVTLGG